jgi:hypothetical protein
MARWTEQDAAIAAARKGRKESSSGGFTLEVHCRLRQTFSSTGDLLMRTSLMVLGFIAAAVPSIAFADDMPPAVAPPPMTPEAAPGNPPAGTPAPATGVVGMTAPSSGSHTLKGASVWGILPWSGIGVGARFMIPLGIKPLLQSGTIKDTFALEFGADILHWSYGIGFGNNYSWNEVLPVVGVMWNVWLNDQLALYPKAELGYAFGWFSGWDTTFGNQPTYGGFFWDVALGGLYKLNNGITLRAEAGYAGLKLGAGYLF